MWNSDEFAIYAVSKQFSNFEMSSFSGALVFTLVSFFLFSLSPFLHVSSHADAIRYEVRSSRTEHVDH